MYAGMMNGSQIPTSLGAADIYNLSGSPVFNLAGMGEVSERGYGPYLGNIFDDIAKIAGKVGSIAGTVSGVASGQQQVVTVPTSTINTAKTVLSWVPYAIGGVILFYALRSKRR
ncbi:MAG: hypothetical protein ACRDRF_00690 [Pseudonocardiaceae bacterium]